MKRFLILLVIVCCSVGTIYAGEDSNVYLCHRKDGKLNFDGRVDDPVWKNKLVAKRFYKSKKLGPAKYQTKVYAMWDDKYLYFAAKMDDEDVVGNLTERDEPIFHEDVFEIFIKPDKTKKHYYELAFSPKGVIYDASWPSWSYLWYTAKGWNAEGILYAVYVEGSINKWRDKDKYWSVEIKIPFKAFEKQAPKKGERWLMVCARCESSAYLDSREYSTSAPMNKYSIFKTYVEWWNLLFEKK